MNVHKAGGMLLVLVMVCLAVVMAVPTPGASAQEPALVVWVDEGEFAALDTLRIAFEEQTGLKVEMVPMSITDIQNQFIANPESPDMPDVMSFSDDFISGASAHLAPLELPDDLRAGFMPFALEGLSADGALYGLPYTIVNLALIRNTTLVPDPPATWNDVFEISKKLVDSRQADYGLGLMNNNYHYYPIMSAFGGYLFGQNPDGSFNPDDIGLNSEGSIQALQWAQDMTQAGYIPVETTWDSVMGPFYARRTAMIIGGPWDIAGLTTAGVPFAVSAFPAGTQPAAPFAHVHGLSINAHSANPKDAYRLVVDFAATEAALRSLAPTMPGFSPYYPILEQTDNPATLGFAAAVNYGQRYPNIWQMSVIWGPWEVAIQSGREGRDPTEALNEAVDQIRANWGQ